MVEIVLTIIIFLLLLSNFSTQRQFLLHLKQLENKLADIKEKDSVETPNEITENIYKDIDDVPPSLINNNN
jgi:hypothetical protein